MNRRCTTGKTCHCGLWSVSHFSSFRRLAPSRSLTRLSPCSIQNVTLSQLSCYQNLAAVVEGNSLGDILYRHRAGPTRNWHSSDLVGGWDLTPRRAGVRQVNDNAFSFGHAANIGLSIAYSRYSVSQRLRCA
jgi:hypothetical protein